MFPSTALLSSLLHTSLQLTPVVGGTTVPPGTWPDAVAVVAPAAMCTGTLVAPDVVLTAGHCIGTHPFAVIVGRVDLAKPGGEIIHVKSATAYPHWQTAYDVGVLVLDRASKAKPRAIAAACTARANLVDGASVEVVGFGLTTKSGTGNNLVMHEGAMPVVDAHCTDDDTGSCNTAIAPDGEFVAGGNGVDACFGDSGGPVYLDAPSGPALVGVVSRGLSEAGPPCGNGGIYVRADRVSSWIASTTHAKLTRTHCAGASDGDDDATDPTGDDANEGGCSASHAAGLASFILVVLAVLGIRRKRQDP